MKNNFISIFLFLFYRFSFVFLSLNITIWVGISFINMLAEENYKWKMPPMDSFIMCFVFAFIPSIILSIWVRCSYRH